MLVALAVAALFTQAPSYPPPAAALTIREWLVSQPFAADPAEDALDRDYLNGEEAAFPEAGRRWQVTAASADGIVDPGRLPKRPAGPGAIYACTYLRSARDASHRLVVASDADIALWLNGQAIARRRIGEETGSQPDTIEVRLAAGWNTLLLKVVNRPQAVGFGAWLVGDDAVEITSRRPTGAGPRNLPAESFTASPLTLSGPLVWRGVALDAATSVRVTPWGPTAPSAALLVVVAAGDTLTVDPLELPGVAVPVTLERTMELGSLARAALASGGARVMIVAPGQISEHAAGVRPSHVLALLDGRMRIDDWRDSGGVLESRVVIPAPLAGVTLDLLAGELGPRARYTIAGESRPWRDGVVMLCSKCRDGAALAIRIEKASINPGAGPPLVRVRDLTYTDVARSARVLAALGGADSVTQPDADAWLRAMLDPMKSGYRELASRDGARLAATGARLRSDTILLVGRSRRAAQSGEAWERAGRSALAMQRLFPGATYAAASAGYRRGETHSPALLDSIRDAVRRGSWSPVGDWWVDPRGAIPSGESLVRRGLYGQLNVERIFGRRCTVGWVSESVGAAWSLPQILRGLGLTAFVVEGPRGRDAGESFPRDGFYWEGLDGTRIFAYGGRAFGTWRDPAALGSAAHLGSGQGDGGRTAMATYEPTIEMLQGNADLPRLPAFPVVRDAGAEAALAAIRGSRPTGGWPAWREDLPAAPGARPAPEAASARRSHRLAELLGTAELLATIDSAPYPHSVLSAAWQRVLFDQFHERLDLRRAWGAAGAMLADSAWKAVRDVRDIAVRRLARELDTRGSGVPIVVFNPASWVRSSYVDVPVDRELSALGRGAGGAGGANALRVIDAAQRATPVRLEGDSVRFFAREVPPLGFKVFWVQRGPAPRGGIEAGPNRLENDHLLVELDTVTGQLTRLYDKVGRREALASGARGNVLQLLSGRVPGTPRVLDSVGALRRGGSDLERWIEVEKVSNGTRVVQRALLRRDEPFLVVASDVDWRTDGGLAVAFDFAAAADSVWYEIPYGALARHTAARPHRDPVAGHRWGDLSTADAGVSVLNDGHAGWDADGRRLRLWMLQRSLGVDQPAGAERYRFRYALYPHTGDWRAGETAPRGIEFTAPLLAVREPGHRGTAGRAWSFLTVSADNVYVGSVKRAEVGRSAVLRLVEWHGRAAQATLTFGRPVTRVRTATLLEDPVAVLPLAPDGTLSIALRPWEIVTLLVDE